MSESTNQERPRRLTIRFTEPSKTKQDAALETNINTIVAKHRRGLPITHVSPRQPTYGDFSGVHDLQGALDLVEAVQDEFGGLSAHIQQAADHNPLRWVEMLSSEEGVRELVEAGMAFEQPPPPPSRDQVEPPAPESSSTPPGDPE